MATTVFISYAHSDEESLLELLVHLRPLEQAGLVDVWHDRRMGAGDDIFPSIEAALDRAAIVLLLVSEAFVASHECAREMWRGMASRERGGAVVVPVILQACNWRATPYGKLNALPIDGAPIATATDRAQACRDVADGVRRLAEHLAQHDVTKRRRRLRHAGGALLVVVIVAGLPFVHDLVRERRAPDIVAAQGVAVVAEIDVVAPDGRPWNPGASGRWRLPNLVLCFNDPAWPTAEICQPAALGIGGGRAGAYPGGAHIADTYPAMTAWSHRFTVELKNRRESATVLIARAPCRFGEPCRIADADGATLGELLVTAAPESSAGDLRNLLASCIGAHSLLARHRLAFIAAGGGEPPRSGTVAQATLLRQLLAIRANEVTPALIDAVLAAPTASGSLPDRSRASVLRAAALQADAGQIGEPLRTELRNELDALRANLDRAAVVDGCATASPAAAGEARPVHSGPAS